MAVGMKRVFINMHYMAIGGAERALLGLLYSLDPQRVSVDLFINQHTGEFMPLIPEWVNVLPEVPAYAAIERPIKDIVREGHWAIAAARLWAKWQCKRYRRTLSPERLAIDTSAFQFVADAVTPWLPSLERLGEYDLAISFHFPHTITADKVRAKRKVAWIHTDYKAINVHVERDLAVWSRFDRIVSISPDCTRSFVQVFPSLEDRIVEIENLMPSALIRRQAAEGDAPELREGSGYKLVSVGRICHAKNYDNVPHMAAELRRLGVDFTWWIVGPGEHGDIDALSAQLGVADRVRFVGAKANPYPYIAAADVYVQPSRYEGKSVTVREAQMLGKPVVITDYATAASQITDGVDGVIVPMDNEGCARGIAAVLADEPLRRRLADYVAAHEFSNATEMSKVYQLMDLT